MGKSRFAVGLLALCFACGDDDGDEVRTGMQPSSADCLCPLDVQIENLAVCLAPSSAFGPAHLFSSHLGGDSNPACEPWRDPQPLPKDAWSALSVGSPCAGQAEFCVAVWAGSPSTQPDDCMVARVCSSFEYGGGNQPLAIPPLGAWVAESSACAQRYEQEGGYLEFLTTSEQLGCGLVDGRGRIVPLCPTRCQSDPAGEGCDICGNGPRVRL